MRRRASSAHAVEVSHDEHSDDPKEVYYLNDLTNEEATLVTMEMPLPQNISGWKRLKRDPTAWMVKGLRKQEVNYARLDAKEKIAFDQAKDSEVSQWVREMAARRVSGHVPPERVMRMRWVLTYKDTGAAKARIVLVGYEDPTSPRWCRAVRRCHGGRDS